MKELFEIYCVQIYSFLVNRKQYLSKKDMKNTTFR
jgi:hypothetical protein